MNRVILVLVVNSPCVGNVLFGLLLTHIVIVEPLFVREPLHKLGHYLILLLVLSRQTRNNFSSLEITWLL